MAGSSHFGHCAGDCGGDILHPLVGCDVVPLSLREPVIDIFGAVADMLKTYGVYGFMAIIIVSAGLAITKLWKEMKVKDAKVQERDAQILELAMNAQRGRLKTAEVLRDVKEALLAIKIELERSR